MVLTENAKVFYTNPNHPIYGEIQYVKSSNDFIGCFEIKTKYGDLIFDSNGNEIETDDCYQVIEANLGNWRYLNSYVKSIENTSNFENVLDYFELGEYVYCPQFTSEPFMLTSYNVFGIDIDEYGVPKNGQRPIIYKTYYKKFLENVFCVKLYEHKSFEYLVSCNRFEQFDNLIKCYNIFGEYKYFIKFNDRTKSYDVFQNNHRLFFGSLEESLRFVEELIHPKDKEKFKILHEEFFRKISRLFPSRVTFQNKFERDSFIEQTYNIKDYNDKHLMYVTLSLNNLRNEIAEFRFENNGKIFNFKDYKEFEHDILKMVNSFICDWRL